MGEEEALAFREIEGELVAVSDYIDALAQAAIVEAFPHLGNSSISASITISSQDELLKLLPVTFSCRADQRTEHALKTIVPLEFRQRNDRFSLAIVWKTGDELRRGNGWPLKELFINVREIRLDVGLVPLERRLCTEEVSNLMDYCRSSSQQTAQPDLAGQWVAMADHLTRADNVDADVLDLLAVKMYKTKNFEKGFQVSNRLSLCFPYDPRGFFRCAAYFSHLGKSSASAAAPRYAWKLAMMLYGEALRTALEFQDHRDSAEKNTFIKKLSAQALQAILSCARHTEFDCFATEAEISDLPKVYWTLMVPWTPRVRSTVLRGYMERGEPDASTLLSLDSRVRMYYYSINHEQFGKLPRFFRWITPFRMAVMSTPRSAGDIEMLGGLGIHNVVTLTKEEPLPKEWFNESITNTFMPVSNYKAPTIAQVDNFFRLFDSSSPEVATLVHCGGGKGRAGTFIACYLARYGFTGIPDSQPRYSSCKEVINIVREMRPGSIETDEQERFISTFVKELWKRAETGGKLILLPEPEPEDSSNPRLHIEGHFDPPAYKLIVCCGIPGSGKSTVSRTLARRGGWVVASQDETGSWNACAQVLSTAMRQHRPVIVDRCNPTTRDREEWINMVDLLKSQTLCLFFDYQEDLCLQRANERVDHPTLEAGRARNAVRSMQKSLQRPSLVEKFGTIVCIRSIAEANRFIESIVNVNIPCSLLEKSNASSSSSSSSSPRQRGLTLKHFYKFPRTRHLMNFGSATRDDLMMTKDEADAFLRSEGGGVNRVIVTFEEKVDGANMGFSLDPDTGQIRAQNRSHFVTSKSHKQFQKLDMWISDHSESLMTVLRPQDEVDYASPNRFILFGEWLQATHSIHYTHLPDYFLAFDIYDAVEDKFLSRKLFDKILKQTSIHSVHRIPDLEISQDVFQHLMNRTSSYYHGPVEGVYVRRDVGPFLLDRAKVVRKDFITGNAHWTKQISNNNIVRYDSLPEIASITLRA